MKKLLFIVIIFSPMLLKAQNLVLNGDFETVGAAPQSFLNWTHSPTYSNIAREISTTKIGGLSTVRFTSNISPAYITSDAITVEPGKTYKLTFTGRIQSMIGASGTQAPTDDESALKLSIVTWDGAKTKPTKFPALKVTSGTNQTLSGTYLVPAGVTAIKLVFGKNKDVAYADDVVLEEVKK
jgi:hypothetical protein